MTSNEGPSSGKAPNDAKQLQLLIQSSLDYAIFTLDPGSDLPKGIRVRGVSNVLLLSDLPGNIETTITKGDGSQAVGKKFAPKGTAQPGTAGVVREEDMPRNFRVIPPKKDVAGITHNMNRLNLVLGEDGQTIVWAFWE